MEISGAENFIEFDFLISSIIDRLTSQKIKINTTSLEMENQEHLHLKMTEHCSLPIFKKQNTTENISKAVFLARSYFRINALKNTKCILLPR